LHGSPLHKLTLAEEVGVAVAARDGGSADRQLGIPVRRQLGLLLLLLLLLRRLSVVRRSWIGVGEV